MERLNKKIVITGATGLIGKKICEQLQQRGDGIIILSRSIEKARKIFPSAEKIINFDYSTDLFHENLLDALSNCDAVIHLAGENIMARRWTAPHKQKIFESRINSTRYLVNAISNISHKPEVLICASAVGFYGNSETEVNENSEKGKGFLADVTEQWEKSSFDLDKVNVRRVNIRAGMVLAKNGGALAKFLTPFKFFIGGPLGSGRQWLPWIHISDLANLFLFALDNKNVCGIVNGVSPNPVTMKEFAAALGKVIKRPSFFKVPEFVLKIILGEASEAVIGGVRVVPQKVLSSGYKFEYENLTAALKDLLR